MRVLLVAETDPRSGLPRRGAQLRLSSPPEGVSYYLLTGGAYVAPRSYSSMGLLEALSSAVRQAARLASLAGRGFDLVHSFFIDLTRFAGRWVHESDESPGQYLEGYLGAEGRAASLIRELLAARLNSDSCAAVITWSKWAAEGFAEDGVDQAKVRVVPPPIPVRSPRPHGTVNVLFVGREPVRKGLDLVLEAAARLLGREERVRFYVVSPGATKLLRRLGEAAARRVVAYDRVPEGLLRDALLPEADVVLAPSRFDAYNLTVLEAMSYGAVPVVSAVGALPELVGDAGVVLKDPDGQALADVVEELAHDERLRAKLGERARALVEGRNDPRAVGRELLKVYEEAAT